jgi:hypothetical protein
MIYMIHVYYRQKNISHPFPKVTRGTRLRPFDFAQDYGGQAESTENYKHMGFYSPSNALHWFPCKVPDIKNRQACFSLQRAFLVHALFEPDFVILFKEIAITICDLGS